MVPWLFFLLAFVMLVLCWVRGEMSVGAKLIFTGIYLLTWLVVFLEPLIVVVLQGVFALGMYFLLFGSQGGSRWRP